MTKRKTTICRATAAERQAGKILRATITAHMLKAGSQTAVQVHAEIGGDFELVRAMLYRMVKGGVAKSVRGTDRLRNSIFSLGTQTAVARDVSKPNRPVLKEWAPERVRDPFHLPVQFFGARAAA